MRESYDGNNITNTLTDTDATLVDVAEQRRGWTTATQLEPVRRM